MPKLTLCEVDTKPVKSHELTSHKHAPIWCRPITSDLRSTKAFKTASGNLSNTISNRAIGLQKPSGQTEINVVLPVLRIWKINQRPLCMCVYDSVYVYYAWFNENAPRNFPLTRIYPLCRGTSNSPSRSTKYIFSMTKEKLLSRGCCFCSP